MNRKNIEAFDYAAEITKAVEKGVLLTTKAGEKVNSMVIGWGHLGRIWQKHVFIAFVRTSRYSRELLDQNPEFTINIALEGLDKKAFSICGSQSGRDLDKIEASGLTLVPGKDISVPAILEAPLTLECRVLYRQEQVKEELPEDIRKQLYTGDPAAHVVYYGEILSSYILEA